MTGKCFLELVQEPAQGVLSVFIELHSEKLS